MKNIWEALQADNDIWKENMGNKTWDSKSRLVDELSLQEEKS